MKHAYMIIAHNEFSLLQKLLKMLDYNNNDIYIHIDKTVNDREFENVACGIRNAHVFWIKRKSVAWASYSLVEVELMLLEAATSSFHDYYHLLSGTDLPIKTHEEIESFFIKNNGSEFVNFDAMPCNNVSVENRVKYYYLDFLRGEGSFTTLKRYLMEYSLKTQKLLKVNRLKKTELHVMKGNQWFDITHQFACYILEVTKKEKLKKQFKYTNCPDELFVQTILFNSGYYEKISKIDIRYIDWSKHGRSPETLTMEYWESLCKSDRIFARKFSEKRDSLLVQKVFDTFGHNSSD